MNGEKVSENEVKEILNNEQTNKEKRKIGWRILDLFGRVKNQNKYNEDDLVTDEYLDEHPELLSDEEGRQDEYLLATRENLKKLAIKYCIGWNDWYKYWDDVGVNLPKEIGKMAEQYVESQDYFFGIHHSSLVNGAGYEDDNFLYGIMKDGLDNDGDASSGIIYKNPPINKTVWPCRNSVEMVMQMKGSYKGSTGAVLVAIPSKYLEYINITGEFKVKEGMESEVYDNSRGHSVIRPKFILGFAQNMGRGSTIKFVSRDELLAGYGDSDRIDETKKSPAGD